MTGLVNQTLRQKAWLGTVHKWYHTEVKDFVTLLEHQNQKAWQTGDRSKILKYAFRDDTDVAKLCEKSKCLQLLKRIRIYEEKNEMMVNSFTDHEFLKRVKKFKPLLDVIV